jgi:excisionase family DNA binding protein
VTETSLAAALPEMTHGLTPREVARVLRVSKDRVRAMIKSGELHAVNTAPRRCGKPRYVVMPCDLNSWLQQRAAGSAPKPARRRKRTMLVDYYPGD